MLAKMLHQYQSVLVYPRTLGLWQTASAEVGTRYRQCAVLERYSRKVHLQSQHGVGNNYPALALRIGHALMHHPYTSQPLSDACDTYSSQEYLDQVVQSQETS